MKLFTAEFNRNDFKGAPMKVNIAASSMEEAIVLFHTWHVSRLGTEGRLVSLREEVVTLITNKSGL
jgi:hypothetical protein